MGIAQLFRYEEVEFEFQQPVERAMENLRAHVIGTRESLKSESLVGEVDRQDTFLYRSEPGSRNSFRPTFYGAFSDEGRKSSLKGVIGLNRVIKKFLILWCALVGLVVVSTVASVLGNPHASWGSVLYVVLFMAACVVFFNWMLNKSAPDVAWLKAEITSAVKG